MVELKKADANVMHQSFAGDVYNSAVYLKRCFEKFESGFISAIGTDPLSLDMRAQFRQEDINDDFVFTSSERVPGLYLINTDKYGERSFTYWRENAAARSVMNFINDVVVNTLKQSDMIFFSGISLAVIEPQARQLFWQRMSDLKTAGVKIVFDPNYRAKLWQDAAKAQQQFEKAFALADILLPGIEDFHSLYGLQNIQQVSDFLAPYHIDEIIVKNGPSSVISIINGIEEEHVITPVDRVVDTTSAGDSFNGAYLGARLNNDTVQHAISLGAAAAAFVIQHSGAIVDKVSFKQYIQAVKAKFSVS